MNREMTTAEAVNFYNLWRENNRSFGEFDVIVEREERIPLRKPEPAPVEEAHGVNAAALLDGDVAATQTPFHRSVTAEVEAMVDAALGRRDGCAVCYRLVNAKTGEVADARIVDGKFGRVWKIAKAGGLCEFVDAVRTILDGKTVKGYRAEQVRIPCDYRYVPSQRIPSEINSWLMVEVYPRDPAAGQRW